MRIGKAILLPAPSPPELRPRSLMPMPSGGRSFVFTYSFELNHTGPIIALGDSGREPQHSWVGVAIVLTLACGLLTLPWTVPGLSRDMEITAALIGSLMLVFAAAVSLYQLVSGDRRTPKPPLLRFDTAARRLECPSLSLAWPADRVLGLQIIRGHIAWTFSGDEDFNTGFVHQLAVLYRADDGQPRRRLISPSFNGAHDEFETARVIDLLVEFADRAGIPCTLDRITGTKVRRTLLARDEPLTSDAFDLPIDAPPILDPKHARPDTSQLTPIPTPPPFCRRCGYVLEGPAVPPRCPECGIDFTKHPNART